jgi:transcriptional regulator with XRE-family HTH domain
LITAPARKGITMTIHDFAFVLDADPHNQDVEDMFFDEPFLDTTLILQNGALALSFDREAKSYKDAVLSAYEDIKSTGVKILSFDPDYLVTSSEIARRVGLSRAAISKYERADIENGFPAPVRYVLSKRPVYDWVPVSKWFLDRDEIEHDEYHHALVSRVMNFGAQAENSMNLPLSVPDLVGQALAAA